MKYRRGESPERVAAWRAAAANGDVGAMLDLTCIVARTADGLEEAERMLRCAADQGSVEGRHRLGVALWRRGELDRGEALIRRAALDGYQDAIATMGNLYEERGENEEALRWYAKLTDDQNPVDAPY